MLLREKLPEKWKDPGPSFHLFHDLPFDMQNVILDFASVSFARFAVLSRVSRHFCSRIWGSKSVLDFSNFLNARKLGTDAFSSILSQCGTRLTELNLSGCSGIDNSAFQWIAKARYLRMLNISRCRSISSGLHVLQNFRGSLESLTISDSEACSPGLTSV
jgi:hypothetical protein